MNQNEEKAGKRKIDIAGFSACMAITFLIGLMGFKPLYDDQLGVIEEKRELTERQQHLEGQNNALKALRLDHQATLRLIDDTEIQLMLPSSLNERLSQISEIATQVMLEIDRVEPGEGINETHYYKIPIRIKGSGDFMSCEKFLNQLHQSLMDISVVSISLKGYPDQPTRKASFDVELVWYASPS
ncbi:type 4a pilus biogenesis protein PilO [Poriferisphaera sp. WC338]|uniref:type 4a pilus biogenesis protein PilO n=1 Tax=Poriferisphaera sp. WC338 TaxID=3425129 RepID=UPI003D81AB6F